MATENSRETATGATDRERDGTPTWTVFAWMLREEWRLHSYLFGGRRFAAFPLFVLVLSTSAVTALTHTGTDFDAVVAGFHALVFAFGLHTGSIGLVGRDAQRNVLPTGTLIVFSARTLPLSLRRLIGIFLLKDAVYYAVLFLLPLTVGVAPAVLSGDVALDSVPVLWLSTTATFVVGVTVTFAGVALSTRGAPGGLVAVGVAAAAGALWFVGDLVAFTPYGLYAGTPGSAALGTVATVGSLLVAGFLAYDPTYESPARSARGFREWRDRLGGDAVLVKSLLDVRRSSGGLFKLVFSGGVLFAVSAFLIDFAGTITGVRPSTGISFGAVLGLTAFTTYNWIASVDSPEDYLSYPLDVPDVFRAKRTAFLLLGPPVGLVYYLAAAGWWGVTLPAAGAGLVLLLGLMSYLFGVTVYLTGFSPNEFLFDTVLFAAFFVAVAVVLVPVLVVGFVVQPVPAELLAGVGATGVLVGVLGELLYRRAVPKWTVVHRSGES
jgi:hypothetical protein